MNEDYINDDYFFVRSLTREVAWGRMTKAEFVDRMYAHFQLMIVGK